MLLPSEVKLAMSRSPSRVPVGLLTMMEVALDGALAVATVRKLRAPAVTVTRPGLLLLSILYVRLLSPSTSSKTSLRSR